MPGAKGTYGSGQQKINKKVPETLEISFLSGNPGVLTDYPQAESQGFFPCPLGLV